MTASICPARFPYLHILSAPGLGVPSSAHQIPMNYRHYDGEQRFEGDAGTLLHVGVENIVGTDE